MAHAQPTPDATRPHACPVAGCVRRFKRRFTLTEHVKTHSGEKPFVCPVPSCLKSFTTSGNLSRHKRQHPWLEEQYECLIVGCRCTFPSEVKLQRHMSLAHFNNASSHLCPVVNCGGAFSTAGNLRRHMKQHSSGEEARPEPVSRKRTTIEPMWYSSEPSSIQSPVAVEAYEYRHPDGSQHSTRQAFPCLPSLCMSQVVGSNDVELLEALDCLFDTDPHPRSYNV